MEVGSGGCSIKYRQRRLRAKPTPTRIAPRYHDVKVIEIAHSCGFNEVCYFNRCFRRRFGATPNEFRGGQRPAD
jgi:AraC-like DNA-binding protein